MAVQSGPAKGVERIGFTQLSRDLDGNGEAGRGGELKVNIVLVHGLGGHPRHTWESDSEEPHSHGPVSESSGQQRGLRSLFRSKQRSIDANETTSVKKPSKVFWPLDFLAQDLPHARVWTYGYNADVVGLFQSNNQNSVSQHGRDLAVKMEREIENDHPIVFIAHSLGGILVKDALHRSVTYRSRTKLVIFLGTPHRGSSYAEWGFEQESSRGLEVNSEVLDNIHVEFVRIIHEYELQVHSFQETHGISGVRGLHKKVVSDFSSKLDLGPPFETVESVGADHMHMARCSRRTDPRYRDIIGVLKQHFRGDSYNVTNEGSDGNVQCDRAHVPHSPPPKAPCHYLPLSSNKRFVGRGAILDQLKEKFFTDNDCQKVALLGLGGIGKTQVALRLVYWAKQNKPEYSIFWASALSNASFHQSCNEIARLLDIDNSTTNEDPREFVRRVLSSESSDKWLLVVDNADDAGILFGTPEKPGAISRFLPDSEDGLILFTSRFREVAVSAAVDDVVELGRLDQQEGKQLLDKRLLRKNLLRDESQVIELLEELTYLPLAIAQAAAYMDRNQRSIPEYLKYLRGTEDQKVSVLSREFHDDAGYPGSQKAVATTFLVSFEQILRSDPDAAYLLQFISVIEPKAVPRSILPRLENNEEFSRAIDTLRAYDFVTTRQDGNMFDMHSLVHLATGVWVRKIEKTTEVADQALEHLATLSISNDGNKLLPVVALPHALRMLRGGQSLDNAARYNIHVSVGWSLLVERQFPDAVKIFEECLEWMHGRHSTKDPRRAEIQVALAEAYRFNTQTTEAIELLERSTTEHAVSAEKRKHWLGIKRQLALGYFASGQVQKATDTFKECLAERRAVLQQNFWNKLVWRFNVADELRELARDVRNIAEAMRRHPEHQPPPPTPAAGRGLPGEEQLKEGSSMLDQALKAHPKVFAKDNPSWSELHFEVAQVYLEVGRTKDAIGLAENALAAWGNTHPDNSPQTLMFLHKFLGNAYELDGQLHKAIEALEASATACDKVYEPSDPFHWDIQLQIAETWVEIGQAGKGIKVLEQAAEKSLALPERHVRRYLIQVALVEAYMLDGQSERAIEILERDEGKTFSEQYFHLLQSILSEESLTKRKSLWANK